MTKTLSDVAIVRHTKTNRLYRYIGDDTYVNLFTGVSGKIKPEDARKMFVINLEMTQLISEYPMIEEMITKLKLVLDK
jgi:hypothetical protein